MNTTFMFKISALKGLSHSPPLGVPNYKNLCIYAHKSLFIFFLAVLWPSRRWRSHVVVFWVVTPCSVVVGYQRFKGPCCVLQQYTVSQPRIPRIQTKST